MRTLIVMAHHDAAARLRDHVLRTVEALATDASRFILVSSSGMPVDDQERLPAMVEYERRHGRPGRFADYQLGLDLAGSLADVDTVVLVDDSFVGPTRSLTEIVHGEWSRGYDVVPMTSSMSPRWHAQPYFLAFKEPVLRSASFRRFWASLDPDRACDDPVTTSTHLEAALRRSGFRYGAYFRPGAADHSLAARRGAWARDVRTDGGTPEPEKRWDPSVVLADRFVGEGALPVLRVEAILADPYVLGGEDLLSAAEDTYPDLFDGVRDSLTTTPHTPRPAVRATSRSERETAGVAYRTRGAAV